MPWLETAPVEQRERFIRDHRLALYTMLSERYGISRKTGYKWLDRFDEGGRQGLQDRSRAPHHCPHRIADTRAGLICDARRWHPSWGPDKLLDWLRGTRITVGDVLSSGGIGRRNRPGASASCLPPLEGRPPPSASLRYDQTHCDPNRLLHE